MMNTPLVPVILINSKAVIASLMINTFLVIGSVQICNFYIENLRSIAVRVLCESNARVNLCEINLRCRFNDNRSISPKVLSMKLWENYDKNVLLINLAKRNRVLAWE